MDHHDGFALESLSRIRSTDQVRDDGRGSLNQGRMPL
jgi:hypothetical protein